MSYVIFHEDPRTHKEVYLVAVGVERDTGKHAIAATDGVERASQFDTARQAYEFAGGFKPLSWWRVGQR